MKQYIYALMALSLMCIAGIPACAQEWRAATRTLEMIRKGTADLVLSHTVKEAIEPAVFASRVQTLHQLITAQTKEVEAVAANLNKPIMLSEESALIRSTVGATPAVAYVSAAVQRKAQLTHAQERLHQLLYELGELQDRAHRLGYTQPTYALALSNGSARLKIDGHTSLVSFEETFALFPLLLPEEIRLNALAVKTLVDTYADMEHTLLSQQPDQAAAWFYLKENFLKSWEEFQAAQAAHAALYPPAPENLAGLHAQLLKYNENTIRINRNYSYTTAGLALDCAKLLKFVSIHENQFPQAIRDYQQVLKTLAPSSQTPRIFHNLWQTGVSPDW